MLEQFTPRKKLNKKEFYIALEVHNFDLRALGPYVVVPDKETAIFPIEIKAAMQSVHLGDGDFSRMLASFCETEVQAISLGSSRFTDVYLDHLKAKVLDCDTCNAGRFFFDLAEIEECRFSAMTAPEIGFDFAIVKKVVMGDVNVGIIYPAQLSKEKEPTEVDFGQKDVASYRIMFDPIEKGGVQTFGEVRHAPTVLKEDEQPTLELTDKQFLELLAKKKNEGNLSFRSLGRYRVIPTEDHAKLVLDVSLDGHVLDFGEGNFSDIHVLFGDDTFLAVDFGKTVFSYIDMGTAKIGNLFLADAHFNGITLAGASVRTFFGERAVCQNTIDLGKSTIGRLYTDHMVSPDLACGETTIDELYLADSKGVERISFDASKVRLANLHESTIQKVMFGGNDTISAVELLFVNKSSIGELVLENLKTQFAYFGNNGKNKIDNLRFGENLEMAHSDIERLLRETRSVYGKEMAQEVGEGYRTGPALETVWISPWGGFPK